MYLLRDPRALLILILFVASANVGLVNRYAAIQDSQGGNVIGIRDVAVLFTCLLGLSLRKLKPLNRLGVIVQYVVVLTPIAAVNGLVFGARPSIVAMESVTMLSWYIAVALSRYASNALRIRRMLDHIMVIGVIVAVGVCVEVISGVAVVTPDVMDVRQSKRSTPSGYVMMMLAYSLFFTRLIQIRRTSQASMIVSISCLAVIAFASLLTQSRTLALGIVFSSSLYLVVATLYRSSKVNWLQVSVVACLSAVALVIVLTMGNTWFRRGFDQYYRERYGLSSTSNRGDRLLTSKYRLAEVDAILGRLWPNYILLGEGLGTQFKPTGSTIPTYKIHSSLGFWPMRYGLVGVILWIGLIWGVFSSLVRAILDKSELAVEGQGLAVGMTNLLACSVFGNVFGVTYGAQQAMIGLGCLIAYENVKSRTRNTQDCVKHLGVVLR